MQKRALGGGVLVLAGALLGRETVAWALAKVLDALTAGMRDNLTWATFPWANAAGVILMLVGLYLIFADRSGGQESETSVLYERMKALYDRLENCTAVSTPGYYPDILGEVAAVFMSLERLGIVTPSLRDLGRIKVYHVAHSYIGALMPMIGYGHLGQARAEAPRIIEGAGASVAPIARRWLPFRKRGWYNAAAKEAK